MGQQLGRLAFDVIAQRPPPAVVPVADIPAVFICQCYEPANRYLIQVAGVEVVFVDQPLYGAQGEPALALLAREPFLGNRGHNPILVEEAGRRVVTDVQSKHSHAVTSSVVIGSGWGWAGRPL
ncbi:MAG: hypothetical protein AMS18_09420 [Gemmatimonas sp. SG8_17]|nr:MAG: hypothetical protein AMS18_09420 [Gemmatimonas sp. SG8_17]